MESENVENRPPVRPNYPPGVKFEVVVDRQPKRPVPKRFTDQAARSCSLADMDRKQREAEQRRKKGEQARMVRIHQTEAETRQFYEATAPLVERLHQQAK